MEDQIENFQMNVSELFQNLKNKVKIFETLSKNIDQTQEQEKLRKFFLNKGNFILDYISNIISEEHPSEK